MDGDVIESCANDRGQAAVVVVFVVAAMFLAVATALVSLGSDMVDRTHAQTAADSAALAALGGGAEAATRFAERHGGMLVDFSTDVDGDSVTVVVRVGRQTATASATDRVTIP